MQDEAWYRHQRQLMLEEQIVPRGIVDGFTLRALSSVPRERFVPPELRSYAYDDGPLPIGSGQTISQPYIVALMTQSAALHPEDRVLEIGTGSGYQAAILGEICREVFTVERLAPLAHEAERTLLSLGYTNVRVYVEDGSLGLEKAAPFSAIIVTAASPQVPKALCRQLVDGGHLIIPVGSQHLQYLLRVTKEANGTLRQERLEAVRFVPLIGKQGFSDYTV